MRNKYTRKDDNYGCTNPDAFNFDPDATINDGSCLFTNDFVVNGCPLEVHPEGGLAGDPDTTDYSTNYVGDEGVSGDNVFILTGVNDEDVIEAAKIYYKEESTDIVIYSLANCEWEDTIVHQIDSIGIEYKDETGTYVTVGALSSETLNLQLSEEMTNQYSESGLEVRITYNFNTDQTPTFSNDARLLRDYEYLGANVTTVITVDNPYGDNGIFEEELTFSNNDMQDANEAEITMEHKLEIHASESYEEISETTYNLNIKKYVEETPDYILGDINGDGGVNVMDIVALVELNLSGEATVETHPEADVNGDGAINVQDVIALVEMVNE